MNDVDNIANFNLWLKQISNEIPKFISDLNKNENLKFCKNGSLHGAQLFSYVFLTKILFMLKKLDNKYKNIYTVKHDEKSGVFENHIDWPQRTKLLKPEEYYIDPEFQTITAYGGGTVDNICIPLAVYLGFKEIYLLGCDALWGHFYDNDNRKGRREWINFKHVLNIIEPMGIKLIDIDPANAFEELEWKNYKDIL